MGKNTFTTDFTRGSIPAHLVKFALPFMASNLLQVLYSLVDMIIVGQYVGKAGLSAVSQGGLLMGFVTVLSIGLTNAGQTLIAQSLGAGKKENLKRVIGTMFTFLFLVALVMAAVVLFFRSAFVDLLRVPPESNAMAADYIGICGAGVVFQYGYNVIAASLRGVGDSRHPFVFITVSSVINLGLDFLLTGVAGFGVRGAAWATVASQIVSFGLSFRFFYRNRETFSFHFVRESFALDREFFPLLMRLGVPLAMQACAVSFSMMAVNMFVNRVGVAASAAFGVGVKIDDLLNKATNGLQYAAAPIIGQNMGAKLISRIKTAVRWCWILCGLLSVAFVAAYVLFGREMFSLFTKDAEVVDLAPVFISAIVWSFPAMALMRGALALMHGTGNTFVLMWCSFLDGGLRVVLSYFFGIVLGLGFFGFSFGFGLAPYGVAIPGVFYYLFGNWKKRSLVS